MRVCCHPTWAVFPEMKKKKKSAFWFILGQKKRQNNHWNQTDSDGHSKKPQQPWRFLPSQQTSSCWRRLPSAKTWKLSKLKRLDNKEKKTVWSCLWWNIWCYKMETVNIKAFFAGKVCEKSTNKIKAHQSREYINYMYLVNSTTCWLCPFVSTLKCVLWNVLPFGWLLVCAIEYLVIWQYCKEKEKNMNNRVWFCFV